MSQEITQEDAESTASFLCAFFKIIDERTDAMVARIGAMTDQLDENAGKLHGTCQVLNESLGDWRLGLDVSQAYPDGGGPYDGLTPQEALDAKMRALGLM